MSKDQAVGSGLGKELPFIGTLKVSAEQSGGALEVIEGHGPTAPPPHVHRERDELFYLIEGRLTFTLGTRDFDVDPGAMVFVPRGTRHGFQPVAKVPVFAGHRPGRS